MTTSQQLDADRLTESPVDPWPASSIPNWIGLSGISGDAHSLYVLLKMHADNAGLDGVPVAPSTAELAKMLGLGRGDKITARLRELTSIGAVEVDRVGLPCRNQYVVNYLPPIDYIGPLTLDDWYEDNAEVLAERRAVDVQHAAVRRARKRATQIGPVSHKAILERHGMVCHICRIAISGPSDLHFDHVVPLVRGGPHIETNILPSHAYCNLWKGVRLMSELPDWTMNAVGKRVRR